MARRCFSPPGQPVAPLADEGVEPSGSDAMSVVDLGGAGRLVELGVGGPGPGVAQVVADGVVEQVRVLADHPDGGAEAGLGEVADVVAVDPDRAARSRRRGGGSAGPSVVLPAPDGPTRATSWPGSIVALTPSSTSVGARRPSARPAPSGAGASRLRDHRVGRGRRSARRRARPDRSASTRSTAPGRSSIGTGASSTSNTRSNDTSAVMMSTRALVSAVSGRVDAADEGGQGEERADRERAGDHQLAADPVDGRAGQRARPARGPRRRCGRRRPSARRCRAPASALSAKACVSRSAAAEQLDEQGAGHVEALGHRRVHRRVEVHLLAGEDLQLPARPAWPG